MESEKIICIECPICLEELEAGVETPCGHQFCTHCLVGWQEKETNSPSTPPYTCPSCRGEIPYIELESFSSNSEDETTDCESHDDMYANTNRRESSDSFIVFERPRNNCKESHKKTLACVGCSLFTTIAVFWIMGLTQAL